MAESKAFEGLRWSEEYELGIECIDEQHKALVQLINDLGASLSANDKAAQHEVLMGLVDYTMNHFIFEEDMFGQTGYVEAPGHKEEHGRFTETIINALGEFEGGKELGGEMLPFLTDWLLHHILKVDKAYVGHFRLHRIS